MMHSNRLRAIQVLAELVVPDDPGRFDDVSTKFAVGMLALGVSIDELRDAMNFALITSEES